MLARRLSTLLVGIAFLGAPATAQEPESSDGELLARARSEFARGLSLEAAGNWAAALEAFEGVGRVRLTPQVRFHIGRCKEHLGRMTEALGDYRVAEYEARVADLPELVDIGAARELLEERIPKVVIELRGEGAVARLRLDGTELGASQLGAELAVDPGVRHVEAHFRDRPTVARTVNAKAGAVERVVIDVPEPTVAAPVVDPAPGAAATDEAPPSSRFGPWPWVAAGVSAASLGASAFFFVQREEAMARLERECIQNVCPESLEGVQADGELYSVLAPVFLGVGIAGAGLSATLFVLDESNTESVARRRLPRLTGLGGFATSRGAGFVATGTF